MDWIIQLNGLKKIQFQNIIKMSSQEKSFVYGMGTFFNIFNPEHRKCFKIAEDNNFFFHSAISYPGASFFYKNLSKDKKKNDDKLILKIAGYSYDQLRYEIDESIKEFNLANLYGFQLWEKLPKKDGNINYKELIKISNYFDELKKNKIIKKTFFQLEPYKFNFDEIDYFDGYAFYGYPNELQLEEKHYEKILKKNKFFLQFQFFGGRQTKIFRDNFKKKIGQMDNKKLDELWIDECINFSNSFFGEKTFFVGCSQKTTRMEYLAKKISMYKIQDAKEIKNVNYANNLTHLTKVDYPIDNHPIHLKKVRSSIFLLKQYIKKILKF